MKWLWSPLLLALVAVAVVATEAPQPPADVSGLWWTEGGAAQVEIGPCDGALCGRVRSLRHPLGTDGCGLRDENNPDTSLRTRSVEGMPILRGLRPDRSGRWSGGTIYDPESGRTYRVVVTPAGPNRIDLRGYIGIELLGRTTTWHRVGAERECRG